MTYEDIELLELAALAVGINGFYAKNFDDWYEEGIIYTDEYDCNCSWNPLVNDGDAFRLAVKCDIAWSFDRSYPDGILTSRVSCMFGNTLYGDAELADLDPYSATRRAIVRAAAEIGKYKSENRSVIKVD